MIRNLTTLILLSCTFSLFSQSPWVKEKGKFYSQLSYTTIPNYNTLFGDPERTISGKLSDNTVQLYAEYGILEKTTFIVNLPYKLITIKDFSDPRVDCIGDCRYDENNAALGNIEFGIKQQFYKKNWVIAGQLLVEANTSGTKNPGLRTGYDAWSFTPLFLAGKSFKKSYLQLFTGVNIRTNGYSSNFKIGGEYGGKITERIWLIGFLDIVKSFKNGDVNVTFENSLTGLYINDQEFGGFGAKIIGEVSKNFGATTSFGGAFFGNNVAKAPAFSFGIYYKN